MSTMKWTLSQENLAASGLVSCKNRGVDPSDTQAYQRT